MLELNISGSTARKQLRKLNNLGLVKKCGKYEHAFQKSRRTADLWKADWFLVSNLKWCLRLWPGSATPATAEKCVKKRFKSCCMLLNGNGVFECRLMVRFQRLEKLGHKLQKSRLLQRKDRVPGLEIGGIMRSGWCCRESLDRIGFKAFYFLTL